MDKNTGMENKKVYGRKYAFPAVFEADAEDSGLICVSFPDLPNCFSDGVTAGKAASSAAEALKNVLGCMEEDCIPIPEPSDISGIRCSCGQSVQIIEADTASVEQERG